jgi:hypothetical protein
LNKVLKGDYGMYSINDHVVSCQFYFRFFKITGCSFNHHIFSQMTWDESRKYCESNSMQLATLETAAKISSIYAKIRKGNLKLLKNYVFI